MDGLRKSLIAAAATLALSIVVPAQAEEPPKGLVRIQKVEVRASTMGPAVLLRSQNRALPIFVDPTVAESIQGVLTGRKPVRPLSHDLMHTMLRSLDARVTEVFVTLQDRTFYGALTLSSKAGARVFDSRSSDAIALAIHFDAPILVKQELLDSNGIDVEDLK